MLDRVSNVKAVMLLNTLLEELREEELVQPCRDCSYPVMKAFTDKRGLLYCGECEENRKLTELEEFPEIKEGEDG